MRPPADRRRGRAVALAVVVVAAGAVTALVVTHRSSVASARSTVGRATTIAGPRSRASDGGGSGPVTAVSVAGGTGPEAAMVAFATTTTVAGRAMSVSASASPPVGWPDGSTVRTDRSGSGARSSALLYVSSVQSQAVYAGAPADRGLLAGWLAPTAPLDELDRALLELAGAREVLTKGHGAVWWVVSPLAAHMVTATEDRARVAVWVVRVIASGANDGPGVVPAVSWTTSTVDLVWTDPVGWSVESVSDVPGPVPMAQSTAQPATSAEFAQRLGDFELVKVHS